MVIFPNGIRKRILRDGASWSNVNAVKEDKTRSGKTKRMLYASMTKRQFSVKMRFTYDEYLIFNDWWENECYYGLNSFGFPQVDKPYNKEIANAGTGGTTIPKGWKEYRFVAGSSPQFSNPSGVIFDCTMQWEEV